MKASPGKSKLVTFWRQTAKPLLTVVIVVTAVRSAIADWNDVPTGSMKPTIVEGDRVFVNKLAYDLKVPYTTWHLAQWSNPKRGDVVVFYSPKDGTRLVKRVVGLPGDRIELLNDHLLVNGQTAVYGALPKEIIDAIPALEQPTHEFATEKIGDNQPHPVMVTPSLPAMRTFGPGIVPENHYFMMGDNRDNSFDSRYFGPVSRDRIIGEATTVVISLNRDRYYAPRWHRFFSSLR